MNTKIKKTLKTTITTLLAIFVVAGTVQAIGTLTPSETAGDDTQYTTNDIFNKLTDFSTTTSAGSGSMTVPESVTASFNTLSEIYAQLEAEDSDLVAGNIADGVEIFGVTGSLTSSDPGLPKTGQTTSYTTGDDGDLQEGIAMSFTDNSNGTVTDNVTGLMWQQDGAYNATSWQDAIDYCTNLTTGTHTDWRLPNIKELQSIVDYGRSNPSIDPVSFTNTQSDYYWSGTTYHGSTFYAWSVNFNVGSVVNDVKSFDMFYARCVR